jgi:hypothetical protein
MSCLLLNKELVKQRFIGLQGYFSVIASEARQSIVASRAHTRNERRSKRENGLPRFARSDGD